MKENICLVAVVNWRDVRELLTSTSEDLSWLLLIRCTESLSRVRVVIFGGAQSQFFVKLFSIAWEINTVCCDCFGGKIQFRLNGWLWEMSLKRLSIMQEMFKIKYTS